MDPYDAEKLYLSHGNSPVTDCCDEGWALRSISRKCLEIRKFNLSKTFLDLNSGS